MQLSPARRAAVLALAAAGMAVAQNASYTYDSAGRLTSVRYAGGRTLTYAWDAAGNLLRSLVTTQKTGPTPAFTAAGVLNSASYKSGPVSPGELIVIFGTGLGPATLGLSPVNPLGSFSTYQGETTVLFDGIPAPVIYASEGQTSVLVPYAVAGKTSTQIVVQYQDRPSAAVAIPVAPSAPGLFSANSSGSGNGAILNEDLSLNRPSSPAAPGSVIVLYGTGEGATNPRGIDGRIAAGVFPAPVLPVRVTIGGAPAEVLYAGAAPGITAGVFQANVRVPSATPPGPAAIIVTVGTAGSQEGLTVAVR